MNPKTAQTEPPEALVSVSEAAHALNRARWAKVSPKKRAEFMKRVRAQRKPGTRQMGAAQRSRKPRCPCGVMTLKRALARGRTWEHRPGCKFHPETTPVTVSADKSRTNGDKSVAERSQGMPNSWREKPR